MTDEIRFTLRLPVKLYRQLKAESARRHESMTTTLRSILREHFSTR